MGALFMLKVTYKSDKRLTTIMSKENCKSRHVIGMPLYSIVQRSGLIWAQKRRWTLFGQNVHVILDPKRYTKLSQVCILVE